MPQKKYFFKKNSAYSPSSSSPVCSSLLKGGKPAAIFFVNLLLCELGFGVGEGVGDVAVVQVAGVDVAAGLCGRADREWDSERGWRGYG